MVGHETEAIYRRYAIVDEAMLPGRGGEAGPRRSVMGTILGTIDKVQCAVTVTPRGGLAQPGRALESHSRGRGFESLTLHHSQ